MPLIIVVVLGLWLFWPRYDLAISYDPEWKTQTIPETGFLTLSGCREAAGNYRAFEYVCLEKTGWGQMFNEYSEYNSKHQ